MNRKVAATTLLAPALAMALSACGGGGGGGNTRSDAPPASPPPTSPPPPPPPVSPPPPPPPPQPAMDAHLALIHATGLAASGHDGSGVRIGFVDSGVNRNHPALQGRVVANFSYVDPKTNNTAVDDVVGHGTTVAQLAAGRPVGSWPGGVAQGAQIVSARIINDQPPKDDGSGQGNQVDGALGLIGVHEDLIAAGVKIMNNSWGGLYWTDPAATAAIAGEYRPFIQTNGGLVVFAAGNESRADPSDMAALPSQPGPNGTLPAGDLERGWLTVAALDTANPTRLASYSNACGSAMRYCLVAPGTAMFTGSSDVAGSTSYWYGSGTSYAAPLVSGAAALVWQAFPYFSNDLVRQTLLGTATDLGAPGADPVFGYGLLDVARAIQGPARLDWGEVSVSLPAGMQSVWSNDITGAGGLVAGGAGQLSLTGANSFSGGLKVRDNARVLLERSFASAVDVGAGSSLSLSRIALTGAVSNSGLVELATDPARPGAVSINGDVANHGELRLGAQGGLSISGRYVQDAGGRLSILLGGPPLSAGSAQLGGQLYVYGINGSYQGNAREPVLATSDGVTGSFASLGHDSGKLLLDASIGYDARNVWLDVTRVDVVVAATALGQPSAATLGAATRVEGAFDGIDASQSAGGTLPPVSAAVLQGAAAIQQVGTASALRTTLDSLSGRAHTLVGTATFQAIDQDRRTLARHVDALVSRDMAAGAWMQGTGGSGRAGAGGSYDLHGWMIGSDRRMGGGVVGLAFGESHADSQLAGHGDRGQGRQAQAQLYAAWSAAGFYALGHFGAGHYEREVDRNLLLGDSWFGASSRYGGRFSSAGLEGGYRVGLGRHASLTPYAGLQHARVETPAFTEAGGLGFALRSEGGETARTLAVGGLRAGFDRGAWQLDAYAEWQQPLSQQGDTVQASFTGIQAWAPLQVLDDGAATLVGASASARLSARANLELAYDQRLGSEPARAWSLRYAFGF